MKGKNITKTGLLGGLVAWFVFALLVISQTSCINIGSVCGGFDLLLVMLLGVGMLAPSYIVALVISIFI
jgi:hypothetical protein